jgi:hypothetical protein
MAWHAWHALAVSGIFVSSAADQLAPEFAIGRGILQPAIHWNIIYEQQDSLANRF